MLERQLKLGRSAYLRIQDEDILGLGLFTPGFPVILDTLSLCHLD